MVQTHSKGAEYFQKEWERKALINVFKEIKMLMYVLFKTKKNRKEKGEKCLDQERPAIAE